MYEDSDDTENLREDSNKGILKYKYLLLCNQMSK